MSPNIDDVRHACEGTHPTVHILQCGHYVHSDFIESCKINCENNAQAWLETNADRAVEESFICQECFLEQWLTIVQPKIKPMIEATMKTDEFARADVAAKESLIVTVIKNTWAKQYWKSYKADMVERALERSGTLACPVQQEFLVDDWVVVPHSVS